MTPGFGRRLTVDWDREGQQKLDLGLWRLRLQTGLQEGSSAGQ